jgi:hypothetical protein
MWDKVKRAEYMKKWQEENKEELQLYRKEHKEEKKEYNREYYREHGKEMKEWNKEYRDKLRLQVLSHYSPELKCQCCGESHVEFLTIDHINNDGAEHKREIGGDPYLMNWLIKNNYPEGFQVLCYNCNLCKGFYEECYHKNPEIRGKDKYNINYRYKVLSHYSPDLKCACCGNDVYAFLSLDHAHGNGNKHRNEVGRSGLNRWIINNCYPEGFRVLCNNCNCSLGNYSYCPHHPEVKQKVNDEFVYERKEEGKYYEMDESVFA